MAEIVLSEWQSSVITLAAPDVRYLTEFGDRRGTPILTLTPKGDGTYLAQSSHYVGLLWLPSGNTLEIRPKVPIANIFVMLNNVNDLGAFLPTLAATDTFTDVLDILIDQFAAQLENILTRGLVRGFITQLEQSISIRGKLNLSQTLRQAPSIRHHSEVPDATNDVLENQLLRLACDHALQQLPLSSTQLRRFQSFSQKLQGIAIDGVSRDALHHVQFNRLNEHYRTALALAELLLLDKSPISSGNDAQYPSYLVDMNRLFERYTTNVLKRVSTTYGVAIQPTFTLDDANQLTIRPDVVIQPRQGSSVPIDVKYKSRLHNDDVYQALAYCHALHTDRAVLIYTNGVSPQHFVIDNEVGVKIVIVVLALDLSGDVTIMLDNTTQLLTAVQRVVDDVPHQP